LVKPAITGAESLAAIVMASEWFMTTVGAILYFGGLLVPVCYLFITRFRGPKLRVMFIGFSVQLALTLILFGVSEMDFQHGNTEAYNWGLLAPSRKLP
jgi:hypothetical protein